MKMLTSFASSINLILIRGTGGHQKGHQRDEYNSSTNQFGLDIDGPKAGFFSPKDEHSKRALFGDDSQDHIIQNNSSPTKENKNVQELDDELASDKILKPTISLKDDLSNTEALISEDENLESAETSKQISASGKIQYNDGKLKQDHPNLKKSDTNETVKQIIESGKLQDGTPKHKTQAVEILDGDKKSNISLVEVPDDTQTSIFPYNLFGWISNYWSPSTNHWSESANNWTKSTNPYENLLWVGVHSANFNFDLREKYRSGNFYKFMKEHNIPVHFLMGHPEFQGSGHQQGVLMTQEQLEVLEKVKNELEEHDDIIFLTYPDTYTNLDDKLFSLLREGKDSDASFVMKSDDDFEITTEHLADVVNKLNSLRSKYGPDHVLYGGGYLFNGDEYPNMLGPHGEHSKYFTGSQPTIFSKYLTQYLTDMNFFFTYYANSSEDKTAGEMIHKIQMEKNISVDYHNFNY